MIGPTPQKPFQALAQAWQRARQSLHQSQDAKAFQAHDRNQDGALGRDEFYRAAAPLRDHYGRGCWAAQVQFDRADANGDGRLEAHEAQKAGAFTGLKATMEGLYAYTTPMDYLLVFQRAPQTGACPAPPSRP